MIEQDVATRGHTLKDTGNPVSSCKSCQKKTLERFTRFMDLSGFLVSVLFPNQLDQAVGSDQTMMNESRFGGQQVGRSDVSCRCCVVEHGKRENDIHVFPRKHSFEIRWRSVFKINRLQKRKQMIVARLKHYAAIGISPWRSF